MKIRIASLGSIFTLLASALVAQTPSPSPTPCVATGACAFPVNTITPAPTPILPAFTPAPYQPKFETRYLSVGGRWLIDPQADTAASSTYFTRGPLPHANSSAYTYPNFWSPLNSQGFWKNGLWRSNMQSADFGGRGISLSGATLASVSALTSGKGLTRPNSALDSWDFFGNRVKYISGSTSIGTTVTGFSSYDDVRILGAANYAFTNFDNPASQEGPDPNLKRIHIFAMAGVEGFAYPSRRISPNMATAFGQVDPRTGTLLPTSALDVTPSVIAAALGMSGGVIIDNKKAGFCVPMYRAPGAPLTPAGYIGDAIGVRSTVGSATDGSWINVGKAVGVASSLYFTDALLPATVGHFCDNCERESSRVGAWVGLEVYAPSLTPPACAEVEFGAGVGGFFADQTPYGDGGAPLMVAQTMGLDLESDTANVERYAGLVSRAAIVSGDSVADIAKQGYDTDVLHVRDVLHLTPRTSPPTIGMSLPPSEKVGLMYFDVARNALRVSVALDDNSADWRSSKIAWVDVVLDMDSLTPVDQGRSVPRGEAEDRMNEATTSVQAKTSYFIPPKIQSVATLIDENTVVVSLLTEGFQGNTPRLFWKLDGIGNDKIQQTGWREIATSEVNIPDEDTLSFAVSFNELRDGWGDTFRPAGRTMKLMAINPATGQPVGSAAIIA